MTIRLAQVHKDQAPTSIAGSGLKAWFCSLLRWIWVWSKIITRCLLIQEFCLTNFLVLITTIRFRNFSKIFQIFRQFIGSLIVRNARNNPCLDLAVGSGNHRNSGIWTSICTILHGGVVSQGENSEVSILDHKIFNPKICAGNFLFSLKRENHFKKKFRFNFGMIPL